MSDFFCNFAEVLIKTITKMYKIFEDIQIQLLYYKYYYHELNEPIVSDFQYDALKKISKDLGTAINKKEDCTSCVHNMKGFNKNNPYWDKVKDRLY